MCFRHVSSWVPAGRVVRERRQVVVAAVFVYAAAAGAGCGSEHTLSLAPPPQADPAPTTNTVPQPPGPAAPAGPDSPWDDLNPGDLPDLHFGIAWTGQDCCIDCDVDAYESDWAGPCAVKYAVVDLRGQIISEFDLDDTTGTSGYHLGLQPGGRGQMLVTTERWPSYDTADESFYAGGSFEVWRLDAVSGTLSRLLHGDPSTHHAVFDATGRTLPIGGASDWLSVAMWPTEPNHLLLWPAQLDCDGPALRDVRIVDLVDPLAPDEVILRKDLLPQDLGANVDHTPFALAPTYTSDGEPALGFALRGGYCSDSMNLPLATWTRTDGVRWAGELPTGSWPLEATFDPLSAAAALHLSTPDGQQWRWRVLSAGEPREGEIISASWNLRPGPMLDAAGPTFAVLNQPIGPYQPWAAIDIFHEGDRVWRIEEFQFGLARRNLQIVDVVLIPPVE